MNKLRIVYIDGPYGIGKTTVSHKIREILSDENLIILDADYYYKEFLKKYPLASAFGGTRPDNNGAFIKEFGNIIANELTKTSSILVIVMALTDSKAINGIIDRFDHAGYKFAHIILSASENTIKARINNDSNRDKQYALQWYDYQCVFLDNVADQNAIVIDADTKDTTTIAKSIITHIWDK